MNHLFSLIAHHGYLLLFLVVLGEAIGLPVPAAVALVAAGAAAAAGTLNIYRALFLALSAALIGDTLLFILGRYMGWALLGLLCRLSVNPESCILRSAESFYKRGKTTLLAILLDVLHPSGAHAALRNAIMSAKTDADWYDSLAWLYGGTGLAG